MAKNDKTNVVRLLESKKAEYKLYNYEKTGAVNGAEIARILNEDPKRVFKTLVTVGKSKTHYVFVIPVEAELDLKKAAAVVGEKKIEMIPQKELLPLTGYIHGGCSPIGMKKFFRTVFHKSASEFESIFFSAGKVGFQVEVKVCDIKNLIRFEFADIVSPNQITEQ